MCQPLPATCHLPAQVYIRAFAWEKAYDLARKHNTHLDTVLYYRQKHLAQLGNAPESIPKLQQLAQQLGAVDEEAVRAKIVAEKEREAERAGARAG